MKKKYYTIGMAACVLTLVSCGTIAEKLRKATNTNVNVALPNQKNDNKSALDSLPQFIEYIDSTGTKQMITQATKDAESGEELPTIELSGITVVAKTKNVPERAGKVSLDFVVTVPEDLISNKWQLKLTPVLFKNGERTELERILLSGADFLRMQEAGYKKYQQFLDGIIPDSLFLQEMIDQKGYKKALADLEEDVYNSWRKDKEEFKKVLSKINKTSKRHEYFNNKMLARQKKIRNESSFVAILPQSWLYREEKEVPEKYKLYAKNEQPVRREITPEDSAEVLKKYYRYDKIAKNEKRKSLIEDKYKEFVKFPYEKARLDTVIHTGNVFQYFYGQDVMADESSSRMQLTIEGMVLAKDESTYDVPPTDTITYLVSSMVNFIDHDPRFVFKIIERQAEANLTSYINYKSGKTTIDEKLADNKNELQKIQQTIKGLTDTGEFLIDSITMVATASPEGPEAMNRHLSMKRATELKAYLERVMDDREGVDTLLNAKWMGEDWGTLALLLSKSQIEDKSEILSLIASVQHPDVRENMLKKQFPEEYKLIREEFYPKLRAVNFKFNLHRRGMVKDTIHTQIPDTVYAEGIKLLENKNYKGALSILSEYDDYNTAVCLMSLGYDVKALEILKKEKDTSNRNYLMAILFSRLKNEAEAVKFYLKSVQQDPYKRFRGNLDPEINKLIQAYKLNQDEDL